MFKPSHNNTIAMQHSECRLDGSGVLSIGALS